MDKHSKISENTTMKPLRLSSEGVRAILNDSKTQLQIAVNTPPLQNPKNLIDYCPYTTGDRVWVQERFRIGDGGSVYYQADESWNNFAAGWRPSKNMDYTESRITLEITHVQVERIECRSFWVIEFKVLRGR